MTDKPITELAAERLTQLRTDYIARLPAELAALTALASGLKGGESERASLDELHHRLHKLVGSGGTFGLAALSTRTRILEQRIKRWLTGPLDDVDALARETLIVELAALGETLTKIDHNNGAAVALSTRTGAAPGKLPLIWLIEADASLGAQLTRQLESFGYAVRHFTRIDDAEVAARTQRPDMLITDTLFMPQAKNATPIFSLPTLGCPLLFVSSNDDFSSRARAARCGVDGYFLKPLDVPRLANWMAQIFDQQRAPPQRVLIVDDDVELAAHFQHVMLAVGMEAEVLQELETIMAKVATFRPDLVLMDLHMPGYSGPELAGVIRQYESWASLPIVYLSAETDLDQQIEALGRGADDFLVKPISDARLVAAVRARVDRARQLDVQISKDSLTGLLKHASIKVALDIEVVRAQRVGKSVTVAMLDIDHFKLVNDTYGHAVGDVVISSIAMLLRQRLRQSDIIGRYGGEEFLVVLPECDAHNAHLLLESIRQRFAVVDFSHDGRVFNCTLSAGLATLVRPSEMSGVALLATADEALYAAKRGGRNQVRVADLGSLQESNHS